MTIALGGSGHVLNQDAITSTEMNKPMFHLPDTVFISLEPWDRVWRRNQFLVSGLARKYTATRFLFLAPPLDLSHPLSHLQCGTFFQRYPDVGRPAKIAGYSNIYQLRSLKLLPNSIAAGRSFNIAVTAHLVQRALKTLHFDTKPLLWVNDQSAQPLTLRLDHSAIVYDITDDWSEIAQSAKARDRVRVDDASMLAEADLVIVCSERLYQLKQATRSSRLALLRNGVEFWRYAAPNGKTPDPRSHGWHPPVLGYTGTLHLDRLDVDLLSDVANKIAPGTIVMIGPNQLPVSINRQIKRIPNIILLGEVPMPELPSLMKSFNITIVPHRVTPFTESLNPLKLYEYLAVGKPIISTPVAGFRNYPQLIYLAETGKQFSDHVASALNEPRYRVYQRRAEAANHTWGKRIASLESLLQDLFNSYEERAS